MIKKEIGKQFPCFNGGEKMVCKKRRMVKLKSPASKKYKGKKKWGSKKTWKKA